jgi:hypothetical protein
MKRLVIFLIIAVLIAGAVSAQTVKEQRDNPSRGSRVRDDNSVKVEGVLKLEKGLISVESSDNVYFVPMLNRYIGFITGLREGAKVSVEGYEFRNMIRPIKVTIEGKSYDFMSWGNDRSPGYGRQDFRSDNDRRSPNPYWNNQRNSRRGGWGSCCY